jgi:acetyltransferase-like isoleucine patch superfamily enzyme
VIPTPTSWPEWVRLGAGARLDAGVTLGYLADRGRGDRSLVLGDNAVIRSGAILYTGTVIGSGLETGHNVVIREENRIGDELRIWTNSTIDYGCTIGDRVKIHCNCYVAQYTVIEDDVFLAPGVTIANDKYPGWADAPEGLVGPTIRHGAQVGANVTILPGVEIGAGALIGAGSVVSREVPPGAVVAGNPARVLRSVAELRAQRTGLGP